MFLSGVGCVVLGCGNDYTILAAPASCSRNNHKWAFLKQSRALLINGLLRLENPTIINYYIQFPFHFECFFYCCVLLFSYWCAICMIPPHLNCLSRIAGSCLHIDWAKSSRPKLTPSWRWRPEGALCHAS